MTELAIYKPVLIAVALAFLWTLETVAPEFIERRRRPSHYAHNLALGLLNAVLLSLVFAAALVGVAEWAAHSGFGLLHWLSLPAWVTWPLAILLLDLWMYLWHRANHKIYYSSVFSWWDRLFRSFRLRKDPSTIRLGLKGYEKNEWRRLDGMLLSPFRRRGKKRRE